MNYEFTALPLSYQPNTGAACRNRTHIQGVEDLCIIRYTNAANLVLRVGLEPTHPKIRDFKSLAATYYAIGANHWWKIRESNPVTHFRESTD